MRVEMKLLNRMDTFFDKIKALDSSTDKDYVITVTD